MYERPGAAMVEIRRVWTGHERADEAFLWHGGV